MSTVADLTLNDDDAVMLDAQWDKGSLVDHIKWAHKTYPRADLTTYLADRLEQLGEPSLIYWIRVHAFDPALVDMDIHAIIAMLTLHPHTIRVLLEVAPRVKILWQQHYRPFWWITQAQQDVMHTDEDMEVLLKIQEAATNTLSQYLDRAYEMKGISQSVQDDYLQEPRASV